MNNRLNKLSNSLDFGIFILFTAAILSFMLNLSNIVRVIIPLGVSMIFFILSYQEENSLNMKNNSKLPYFLGLILLVYSYFMAGTYNLLGNLLVSDSYIFLHSIFILIGILLIVSSVKYKSYILRILAYVSLVFGLFNLLRYYNIEEIYIMITISALLLIYNIFKFNKKSEWLSIVFILASIVFYFDSTYIIMAVLFALNVVNLLVISYKDNKNNFISFIIMIVSTLIFTLFVFGNDITNNIDNIELILFILLSVEDIIYSIICNNSSTTFERIIINALYFTILIYDLFEVNNMFNTIIMNLILLCITVFESYIINNNDEKKILPFKFELFFVVLLYKSSDIIPCNYSSELILLLISLAIILISLFVKNNTYKKNCDIALLFIDTISIFYLFDSKYVYFLYLLLAISYYFLRNNSNNNINNWLKVDSIIFLIVILYKIFFDNLTNIELLINIVFFGYLLLMNRKKNNIYALLLCFECLLFVSYISNVTKVSNIQEILVIGIMLLFVILFSTLIYDDNKSRLKFISYFNILFVIMSLVYGGIYTYIGVLIISIVIIICSYYYDVSISKYMSIVEAIFIALIILIHYSIPFIVLLFIIGLLFVFIIPLLMKKYEENDNYNDNYKVINYVDKNDYNYCPKCGAKLEKEYRHCPKCGFKIK